MADELGIAATTNSQLFLTKRSSIRRIDAEQSDQPARISDFIIRRIHVVANVLGNVRAKHPRLFKNHLERRLLEGKSIGGKSKSGVRCHGEIFEMGTHRPLRTGYVIVLSF